MHIQYIAKLLKKNEIDLDVSWRACVLRLLKILSSAKILLFLTIEVLCHVQSAEIYSDFNIGRGLG